MLFCRKCGASIPDDSAFCPCCGEKILHTENNKAFVNQTSVIENKQLHKETDKVRNSKKSFSLDSFSSACDFLFDIPFLGVLFRIFFFTLAGILALCLPILGFGGIYLLIEYNPLIGMIVLLTVCNAVAFYVSYKQGARKKWFFWVSLVLSLLFIIYMCGTFLV